MSGGSRHVAAHPERLAGLLEPVVSAAGLELESVRVGRAGRRSLLRVVVDAEQGVSLDDIAVVSRAVAAEIDAGDLMGAWALHARGVLAGGGSPADRAAALAPRVRPSGPGSRPGLVLPDG